MIASGRGLAVAVAVAIALAAIVVVDVARAPAPLDRALVPGFDPARATELVWERSGRPALRAVRVGDRWELRSPGAARADASAIGDVLAALRGGRWHRQGPPRPSRVTLTVVAGAERHVIGLGEPIAGTEQSWIVDDGRGVVVDSWIVRALDRDPLSLRIRRPLAEVAGAQTIEITGAVTGERSGDRPGDAPGKTPAASPGGSASGGGVSVGSASGGSVSGGGVSGGGASGGGVSGGGRRIDLELQGTPRRLTRPSALLLAPEIAGELERAIREVTIVRVLDGPVVAHGLAIRIAGHAGGDLAVRVELGGSCPGAPALVALSGTAGDGCVERAGVDAIERAAVGLYQPPAAIVERRPVPFEPRQVVLADGVVLDASHLQVGEAAADASRAAELFAALAAPAGVTPLPAAPPIGRIVASDPRGAAIELDLYAARVLARHGEPVALAPAPGAWSLLVRPSRELRELTLWVEEPTTITAIAIGQVRYERGAVIGAWTRPPGGALDAAQAARVEELVAQLAAPRALGFAEPGVRAAHRVTLEVTPPVGAPAQHVLELGAPRGEVCPARVAGDTVRLSDAVCRLVAALAR